MVRSEGLEPPIEPVRRIIQFRPLVYLQAMDNIKDCRFTHLELGCQRLHGVLSEARLVEADDCFPFLKVIHTASFALHHFFMVHCDEQTFKYENCG